MKLVRRLLHIFLSLYVLRGLLAAVQLRRKNWHFSAFRTLSSPCTHPSVSLTVLLWGNKGPLLTHLPHTHTHPLSFYFCISLLFFPLLYSSFCPSSLHLRSIWCQRSCCQSHFVRQIDQYHMGCGPLDGHADGKTQTQKKRSGNEINMLLCDHPTPKSLNSVNKA